jgi:hypothetical protein
MAMELTHSEKLVRICDPFALVEPLYPEYFTDYTVEWYFSHYNFRFERDENDEEGLMAIVSSFSFGSSGADAYMSDHAANVQHALENGKSITTWREETSKVSCKYVEYKMEFGEKIVKVREVTYQYDDDAPNRKTNFMRILIYDGSRYLSVTISNYNTLLQEEEILQFGIREYVETQSQ